jgi:hypothetical protein
MATFTERLKSKGTTQKAVSFTERYKNKQLSSQIAADVKGDKKDALLEQRMNTEPIKNAPIFSGIDDVAQAKAEKFGVKQVGANPFQTPKLDPSVNSFMTGLQTKQSGVKPVQIGSIEAKRATEVKTPIDQRLHFGGDALKDDSRSYIGMNLVPAYKEDDPLTKVGKGAVNYGIGGALSLASNIGGAAQQGIMQATRAGVNAIQGKPQDFREMSFGKDILGAKEDNLLTQAAATVLDPATYIGGGIVDDLSRAGFMGKASRPSTEMVQVLGESQQKLLAKMRGALSGVSSIADEAIPLEKVNTVKPSTLDGKFKIKNSAYDDVVKEYNDAIETIQNHFRTNELRTNEIPLIKSELGIDLDDIINRMEIAENGVQLPGTDTMRLKRAAGAASDRAYKLADDVRLQGVGNKVDDVNPLGGKLPKTETPQGRIYSDTPKGDIPEGMKERGFSRNVRTDAAMPDDIRVNFDESPLSYKQVGNAETLAKAEKIMESGQAQAMSQYYDLLGKNKPEAVPLAKLIAKNAEAAGDIATARAVLSDAAEKLTEAGQFSQAAKILREADPETFLMTIDKQIRKLNEQGLKQYGKKWSNVDLLADEISAIQNIPIGNQQAYEQVWEQIGSRIAKQLPSTGMEKFDAWRRIAMLLNPKTHIRNTVGNVVMAGMRKTSDTLGAGLEKLFGVKERTKSFGWSLNKNVASKVDETWDVVKKDILGESRWEIDNLKSLGMEKDIFKNKALQGVNEFSLKTLNAEDNIFTQRAFKDALGQFMQSNRLTEATDTAIAYAKRRALEATYKQANKLATWINQAKQIPGAGKLVEAAIPFSKTPANIMKTAFEYSPAGLTKLIFSKGKPAAEVIETLSKGLTGTAIAGLGFALASMGAAKTQNSKSNKVSAIDAEMGEQAYSIITPQGSYTFDWAQPFAVPLAMGIAMYEGINNKDELDFDAIMDSIAQGGDSFFNMSMLQNIKKFLGYGSTTENVLGLPWNYVQQAWPSLFGQVAKTVDDTKRSTYDPNPTKQTWNQLKSRIPFASKSLEPSLNVWGEEQKQGGVIQQFINPGYSKKASNDPVTKEISRLHAEFGSNDMLPKMAQNFTINGEPTKLSPKDMTQFQREMGQMNYLEIKELINSPKYSSMTDEEKMKKIKKIVGDNYDEVKEGIIQRNGLKPSK